MNTAILTVSRKQWQELSPKQLIKLQDGIAVIASYSDDMTDQTHIKVVGPNFRPPKEGELLPRYFLVHHTETDTFEFKEQDQ